MLDIFDEDEENKDAYEYVNDNTKTGFEGTTDKGLVQQIGVYGQNYEKLNMEMTRRLIKEIRRFNKISSRYSKIIIWLTIVLGIFAIIQISILVG